MTFDEGSERLDDDEERPLDEVATSALWAKISSLCTFDPSLLLVLEIMLRGRFVEELSILNDIALSRSLVVVTVGLS